jgi:hypothetical protein
MIKLSEITQEQMDTIAEYMDDDTREHLHASLAPCTPQTFLKAYLDAQPDFLSDLQNAFFEDVENDL